MAKKIEIRIRDPRAWKPFFRLNIIKFFDADPDQGSRIFLTLEPE
jgi:hypothetical protein